MPGFEEEPSDESSTVMEWSFSGIFETDEGIRYKLSKEEVLAYLMAGNADGVD
jgi:hypothetical protein